MKKYNLFLFSFLLLLFFVPFSSSGLVDNIRAYYAMDGTTGTMVDSTGYQNGVTTTTTGVTGILNNAYLFEADNITSLANTTLNRSVAFSEAFTLSLWLNSSDTGTNRYILGDANSALSTGFYMFLKGSDEKPHLTVKDSASFTLSDVTYSESTTIVDGSWHHLVITFDGVSGWQMYIDGNNMTLSDPSGTMGNQTYSNLTVGTAGGDVTAAPIFNGTMDELGLWNRVLSSSEISLIYNGGSGLGYPFGLNTVVLQSPSNGSTISGYPSFNISALSDDSNGYNISNVTLYIWNSTGDIKYQNTTTLTGISNTTQWSVTNLDVGNYTWNVLGNFINGSILNSTYASSNFSFNYSLYSFGDLAYTETVTEGALNSLSIPIIVAPSYSLTEAYLNYNNTNYTTSISYSGNTYNVSSSISVPIVSIDTNFSLSFFVVINGDVYQTTISNQTVQNLDFAICGGISNDTLLNLSLVDEEFRTNITGEIQISANLISKSSGEVIESLNGTFSNVSSGSICFSPPSDYGSYYLDSDIRYSSTNYASEFYTLQKADLSDYPKNLTLFDLALNSSTEFLIKYQDDTLTTVEGAVIQLLRKYIGSNVYELVEAPLTSAIGTAIVHIDLNTNLYRAIVVKDGVILDTFDNIVFNCENELSGQCTENLFGEIDPQNSETIDTLNDFSYTVTLNNNTLTTTFSIPSGSPALVNIYMNQVDTFGNSTVCNQTITSSSGSIDCTYNNTIGDSIVYLQINKDGVEQAYLSIFVAENGTLDFLGNNYFIVFILLLSLAGMAVSSPEWIVVNGLATFVFAGGVWLLNGLNFVVGLGSLIWLVIAAGILIFKLTEQEDR